MPKVTDQMERQILNRARRITDDDPRYTEKVGPHPSLPRVVRSADLFNADSGTYATPDGRVCLTVANEIEGPDGDPWLVVYEIEADAETCEVESLVVKAERV